MASFMYLFRGNQTPVRSMSPEQMQQVVKKWMDWRNSLEKSGHIQKLGERLAPTGKVVRGRGKAVTDGPYAEAKDIIGGYMVAEADDIDQAVELAKGCPIFETDGAVEIRPIMSM